MSSDSEVSEPRRIIDLLVEAIHTNDPATAAALYSDDVIIHDPLHDVVGHEAAVKAFAAWFDAFKVISFDVVETIAEGTRIAVHWKWKAIHQGEYLGVPPTGKEFNGWHVLICDTRDGKVSRDLSCWDCTQLLELQAASAAAGP
jgi:steroid delta-isomerase-like uncharacterized protein